MSKFSIFVGALYYYHSFCCNSEKSGDRCDEEKLCIKGTRDVGTGVCICEEGWDGELCEYPVWLPNTCQQGSIDTDGNCVCVFGWEGERKVKVKVKYCTKLCY
eukprot:TRINITY_DN3728_c0_g1_i1.p1 TRINITY_DN3728_c0_g1~~TRINITY_DN3728_c0_g1_i1.p1  ORF type:complete len:103 (-),score=9.14 TRINITY_DN3728_c0_g1_i1:40-348(-)